MANHLITAVEPGSIAEELGIEPGDALVSINGRPVADVLDYRFLLYQDALEVQFVSPTGQELTAEIEKEYDEDLGLIFERPLMDRPKACHNKCIFCFIDQLPPDVRKTMKFKDDDWRLSFLQGNYTTLTNVSDTELQRIIEQHISPLFISVHTMDPALRVKMTSNPKAAKIREQLSRLQEGGIDFHVQIVLCPGVNDGEALQYTLTELAEFRPACLDVAMVPVGLTQYRDGLYPLTSFTKQTCREAIRLVEAFAQTLPEPFAYLSDEFYVQAELPPPPFAYYKDFELTEDGIGLMRYLQDTVDRALAKAKPARPYRGTIATGQAAYPLLCRIAEKCSQRLGIELRVVRVENRFFGERITVAGLLTGQDLYRALKKEDLGEIVYISRSTQRADEDVFLDDMSLLELQQALGVPVRTLENDGEAFVEALCQGKEYR